jgi:hypothetical protein
MIFSDRPDSGRRSCSVPKLSSSMLIALRYRAVTVSVLAVLFVIGHRRDASARRPLESAVMPRTLKAEADLMPQIAQMLAASPTFRTQCARLDRAEKLAIILRMNPLMPKGLFRARSTIRRYSSGLLIVTVEVAPGSDQAEWIAHEFEHVLEMLDGEQLVAQARRPTAEVWQSGDGMIETSRATDAGRAVLIEMRLLEPPDKFVE